MNNEQAQAITNNLLELTPELQSKLVQGLKNVPINQMLQQVQYLQTQMLPKAEKAYGRDNDNYRFYSSIVDTLVWAMFILDRYEHMALQYNNNKLLIEFYQQRCTGLEQQLQKYTTTEDLLLNDGLSHFSQSIGKRLQDLINSKNGKQ